MQALGIHRAFDFCADASRIARSKPDPEIFLAACAGLNVLPEEAIGIEDAGILNPDGLLREDVKTRTGSKEDFRVRFGAGNTGRIGTEIKRPVDPQRLQNAGSVK